MNAPESATPAAPSLMPRAAVFCTEAAAREFAQRELARRILVFGTLLGWCAVLLIFRMRQAETIAYAFLEWNLFLAVIPAVAAWFFARAAAKRSPMVIQAFWFALWLVFLPNAPYVMTDLVHLGHSMAVPIWYDLMLLGSCGATGLLLGYTSLADVQAAITRRFSSVLGWAMAITGLLLSGFAIYLGRFLRLNSWETVTRPLGLLSDIARLLGNPGANAQVIGVTLIYGAGLLLGYIALRMLAASLRPGWAGAARAGARCGEQEGW
jgi:uncharacterized membrane protein